MKLCSRFPLSTGVAWHSVSLEYLLVLQLVKKCAIVMKPQFHHQVSYLYPGDSIPDLTMYALRLALIVYLLLCLFHSVGLLHDIC